MRFEMHRDVDARDVAEVILRAWGDLDVAAHRPVVEAVQDAAARSTDVVVDLRGVSFIDAAGLGLLVRAQRIARSGGARLHLRSAPETVRRVMNLVGLTSAFTLVEPLES